MTNAKFLSKAQKCEAIDSKERQKLEKAKEALKRKKQDNDGTSTLSSSHQSKNNSVKAKKAKHGNGTPSNAGVARFCKLCKMSGAPEFVYSSHSISQCKKKDEYARKLSGSAGKREGAKHKIRSADTENA